MGIYRCKGTFKILNVALLLSCFAFCCCKPTTKPVNAVTAEKAKKVVKPVALKNCEYSNDVCLLGIGLVMATDSIELFRDSLLTNIFVRANMYSSNMDRIPVYSKFYKPDYGIMHFVCLGETGKSYKILNGKSDVQFLPKTKAYKFITWGKYIMSSFGVRRTESKPTGFQPLRVSPGSVDTVAISKGLEIFCPVKVEGDWLQVKWDCFYNDENSKHEGEPCSTYISKCKNPLTGWLKWRDGNKLLIDILIME